MQRRSTHRFAGVTWLLASLVLGEAAAATDVPTNSFLIGCMPDDVEAVMILRAQELLDDGCALKREFQSYFGKSDPDTPLQTDSARDLVSSNGQNNLDRVFYREIIKRKPLVRVLGGAAFKPPTGIGIGRFAYLTLWVTEDSNAEVRKKIEQRVGTIGDVATKRVGDVTLCSSRVKIGWSGAPAAPATTEETVYVAFPNEHISILTHSEAQARHLIEALAKEKAAIPERWKRVATAVDVEAPLLILKTYPHAKQLIQVINFDDPRDVVSKRVGIDSFALSTPGGTSVRFLLRCNTADPDIAVHYYYGQMFHGGFMPPYWKWDRESDKNGFTALVEFKGGPRAPNHHSGLVLLTLFGTFMAI